uniref:FYVE-type domain-containing protein n=1 Tax=Lygus hesperus TaxID=30085 RepID=A0A0K8SNW7_LYGHE
MDTSNDKSDLSEKIANEEEHRKLQEEVQRLRSELDEARQQVTVTGLHLEAKETERLKSQDELASLQQFVNSTLEESGRYELEIQLLKSQNDQLQGELQSLKTSPHHHGHPPQPPPPSGGAESVLVHPGQMFSTLARKVAQLGTNDSQQHSQAFVDNLEESMRKAEVLKSLLDPLEEEIKSLKDKLRETDEKLQRYRAREEKVAEQRAALRNENNEKIWNHEDSSEGKESSQQPDVCDMCLNYEEQLVQAQTKVTDLERQLAGMERYKEQLNKETVFRKQMEEKWTESKEEHKTQVTKLQVKLEKSEKTISELKQLYARFREEINQRFSELNQERKRTQDKLDQIVHENETLVGKFIPSSQSLQNEDINLPDSVEALQEMWLEQRDNLIKARLGMEQKEGIIKNLECISAAAGFKQDELEEQISSLNKELSNKEKALIEKTNRCAEMDSLKQQLEALQAEKRKLEESEGEMRNRLLSLQTGLENGEAVQKDFVRLSQSLQKELERLREQHKELRWEHEDDVSECRGCEQPFKSSSRKKVNCKHCGRIFCLSCLQHKVTSGPNQREWRVCVVCHTLLNSETAPYFSTEPPHQVK